MADQGSDRTDPYSRVEYRQLIAWQSRIEREKPFLLDTLGRAPDRSVFDVGCGTGEHTAFFARAGARAVGMDRSEAMIERARDHETRGEGRFLVGDAAIASDLLAGEPSFGMAICLGNMLPHVLEDAALEALFDEMAKLLLPGGLLLIQILNYRRILDREIRHLPLNFRSHDEDDGETVFVRLLKPIDEKRILFFPTTLVLDPDREEPVTLRMTRRVELRPWTAEELLSALESRGFSVQVCGDMTGGLYAPQDSPDLVLVATQG